MSRELTAKLRTPTCNGIPARDAAIRRRAGGVAVWRQVWIGASTCSVTRRKHEVRKRASSAQLSKKWNPICNGVAHASGRRRSVSQERVPRTPIAPRRVPPLGFEMRPAPPPACPRRACTVALLESAHPRSVQGRRPGKPAAPPRPSPPRAALACPTSNLRTAHWVLGTPAPGAGSGHAPVLA